MEDRERNRREANYMWFLTVYVCARAAAGVYAGVCVVSVCPFGFGLLSK